MTLKLTADNAAPMARKPAVAQATPTEHYGPLVRRALELGRETDARLKNEPGAPYFDWSK
jgi:hypothetical protein